MRRLDEGEECAYEISGAWTIGAQVVVGAGPSILPSGHQLAQHLSSNKNATPIKRY